MGTKTVIPQGFVLTTRDLLIVAIVALLGVVEGRLLVEMALFGSIGRGNFRLAQLVAARYLVRYVIPTAPRFSRAVYGVGLAAVPLVPRVLAARNVEPEADELVRLLRPVSLSRVAHSLAIGRIFAAFYRPTAVGPVRLERWLPEVLLRTSFQVREQTRKQQTHCFAPDAFVRLEVAGEVLPLNLWIECDLGSVNSTDWAAKLVAWSAYLHSGLARETFGEGHQVLLVVAGDEGRIGRLSRLALRLKAPAMAFTTFDIMARCGLGPGYRTASSSTPVSLIDLPQLLEPERNLNK